MTIKIGFWNINGLAEEKMDNPDFKNIITQYDIICLTETWDKEKNEPNLNIKMQFPGYSSIKRNRKNKHKKARRNSGGILIIYKNALENYIKVVNKKDQNILWIKIDKYVTGEDITLATVYISPINSTIYNNETMTEDTFTTLRKQIATYMNEDGIMILGGDFNARTGRLLDFIEDDNEVNNFVLQPGIVQNDTVKRKRMNQDNNINKFGHELRDICICTNMKILNGRTIGDIIGQPTYIGPNGTSTVDYIIASDKAITGNNEIIQKFKVEDLNILSDHRPLSLFLNSTTDIEIPQQSTTILKQSKNRKGKQMYNPNFAEILNSKEIKIRIKDVTNKVKNKNDKNTINDITTVVENLLINVSDIANLKKAPAKQAMNNKTINNHAKGKKIIIRNLGTTFNVGN